MYVCMYVCVSIYTDACRYIVLKAYVNFQEYYRPLFDYLSLGDPQVGQDSLCELSHARFPCQLDQLLRKGRTHQSPQTVQQTSQRKKKKHFETVHAIHRLSHYLTTSWHRSILMSCIHVRISVRYLWESLVTRTQESRV